LGPTVSLEAQELQRQLDALVSGFEATAAGVEMVVEMLGNKKRSQIGIYHIRYTPGLDVSARRDLKMKFPMIPGNLSYIWVFP